MLTKQYSHLFKRPSVEKRKEAGCFDIGQIEDTNEYLEKKKRISDEQAIKLGIKISGYLA